jgi:hypothetical protein
MTTVVKAAKRGIESEPGDLPFLHDYVIGRRVNVTRGILKVAQC